MQTLEAALRGRNPAPRIMLQVRNEKRRAPPGSVSVCCGAPAPPRSDRRLRGDFQQQVAEAPGAGAALGRPALAFCLEAGGGTAINVVGQRDQPDEEQILAAGARFEGIRHDITPCRQSVDAVGCGGEHSDAWNDRTHRPAVPLPPAATSGS